MNPTRYEIVGPCAGVADLWEEASETLSSGSLFPSVWSQQTKNIMRSGTTLKRADGREFILTDLKMKEIENGGGYYSFKDQA